MAQIEHSDIVLIGSGIMSATLATMLKQLAPDLTIQVYEAASELAHESSDGWNNAGTGHAGICELSYTPTRSADGLVDVSKAISIFEEFEQSLQFWSFAVTQGMLKDPASFVHSVPHISFVHGQPMVEFLHARYKGMAAHHFFSALQFTSDRFEIGQWAPLLVDGRGPEPIAATKMLGTDVNFGEISRQLLRWLSYQPGCSVLTNHRVTGLSRKDEKWNVRVKDLHSGELVTRDARFVFIGAGGGSLPLLQKAGIPEAQGLGGFPIGGQWLVCEDSTIVERHLAKVYGQPLEAAPTMAVPHLDTRWLNGKKTLLFGPFASWTTKFLHQKGSITDLPFSIRPDNLLTLLNVGIRNLDLVRYLVQQGTQSLEDRLNVLRIFYPEAKAQDWKLIDAGIRVQAIKKTDGRAGIVHYGTEVITDATRSLSALLGASPGASVSVNIVLQVVKLCFPHLLKTPFGQRRLMEMIPSFDDNLKQADQAIRSAEIACGARKILLLSQ